jgi:hypothetical protein
MWETNPWSHVKAKRNYHVFHAKLAILVLMWKKKKKNKQSISLSFSWWNQKKKKWTVSLFIHMEVIHLPFSYGITNPMSHHVASRDEEKKKTIHLSVIVENNPLSHVEVTT